MRNVQFAFARRDSLSDSMRDEGSWTSKTYRLPNSCPRDMAWTKKPSKPESMAYFQTEQSSRVWRSFRGPTRPSGSDGSQRFLSGVAFAGSSIAYTSSLPSIGFELLAEPRSNAMPPVVKSTSRPLDHIASSLIDGRKGALHPAGFHEDETRTVDLSTHYRHHPPPFSRGYIRNLLRRIQP